MNREQTKQAIEVMTAWLEGKQVQRQSILGGAWVSHVDGDRFNFAKYRYRIKPEPREFWIHVGEQCILRNLNMESQEREGWIKVREVTDE